MNQAIRLDDLNGLAAMHRRAFPDAPTSATADFIANAVRCAERPVPTLAQDALPLNLGGPDMPVRKRRYGRDQLFERDDNLGVRPDQIMNGGFAIPGEDQDDPDVDYNPGIDPSTAGDFVRLLCRSFGNIDDDGDTHNEFLNQLGQIVQEEQVNGDRRRRGARDELQRGGYASRSPGNGIGSYGAGATGSPTEHDSALVDSINRSGFESRWGETTRHIKFSANGRY